MTTKLWRWVPIAVALVAGAGAPAIAVASDNDHKRYDHDHGKGHAYGKYGPASLTVRNDFDGTLELWVDGRFMQNIAGNSTANVSMRPGYRDFTLRRPETGFVLARSQLALRPGRTEYLPVAAPIGQMTFFNAGVVPMRVQVDRQNTWVDPGQRVQLAVETGNVRMTGYLRDPRGEWEAMSQVTWLEPGRPGYQTLRPESALILVTNHERFAVRALVDGIDVGLVAPGDTRRVWVRPGSAYVSLMDSAGRTRSSTTVNAVQGREARVVFQMGGHCDNDSVVMSRHPGDDRPYGPPRQDGYDGYGYDTGYAGPRVR